jgi:acetylornithine deacetylase/succinyl-diaminopimelate desuccinylase-like protein
MATKTKQVPFSKDQERWYQEACEHLDGSRLRRLLMDLINVHSPTGLERQASEFMANYQREHLGGNGHYQPIDEHTGNCYGEIKGSGGGATLMLYAPIDTHIDYDAEREIPWVGREFRPDMIPKAFAEGDMVFGLGAANPKGMVATLNEIATALYEAKVPIKGDLVVASAGGGMPVSLPYRRNYGLSDGVYHLLTRGVAPDFAVIMKPWWVVFHEEPGCCWFKVRVFGTMGYAGITRGTPGYRSSIIPATTIINDIEKWLPEYTKRNTSGNILPEGHISSVRAGWPERPAFPSATTEIYLDVRCNPRTLPGEVKAQFAEFMVELHKRHPEIEFDWEMTGSGFGGATDQQNWIIQSSYRGWELVEGKPHGDPPLMGGQTDGAIIRRLGIPCARIGYPWPPEDCPKEYTEGLGGMGVANIADFIKSAKAIMYVVIDTLTRTRSEVGL